MPWEARLQFLQAVFFTFSGVGFLLDLANPKPGRTAHIVFLVFVGGAIGVAYGFCFMRAPGLLPVLVAVHVVLALVLTPYLGSLAVDWAQVASTAAGVDVIGAGGPPFRPLLAKGGKPTCLKTSVPPPWSYRKHLRWVEPAGTASRAFRWEQ